MEEEWGEFIEGLPELGPGDEDGSMGNILRRNSEDD